MKNTVLKMGNEDFDFEEYGGKLLFSTETVELNIAGNGMGTGSFLIVEESGSNIKGFVTTSDIRMKCIDRVFNGTRCEIRFSFVDKGLASGTRLKGKFFIISDKGEYCLPYEVNYEPISCNSSLGEIKNLFHFANLAKESPEEAIAFFYSPDFTKLLTGSDRRYRNIYRGLSHYTGNQRNMDEFLIAVRKKARMNFSTPESEIYLDAPEREQTLELKLQRTGWGYTHLNVTTDADFIVLSKEEYFEEDFMQDTLAIPYMISRASLHKGNNHGSIVISDGFDSITVLVQVHKLNEKNENGTHVLHRLKAQLTELYLKFYSKNLSKMKWLTESQKIIDKMLSVDDKNMEVRLYQIQMLLFSGRKEDASKLMEKIASFMGQKECPQVMQAYFLYLSTFLRKEEGYLEKITSKIKKLCLKNESDWRYTWMLLFLDREISENEEKRYFFLKEQYELGAMSPFLYAEAVRILKRNPAFLVAVSDYERQLIRFAIRNHMLTEGFLEQTVSVFAREREYSNLSYRILVSCYELKAMDQTLQTICLLLMKASRQDADAFQWYSLAVEREIKLNGLYEYYMMSADMEEETILPRAVMLYFLYENQLDYERVAYLYANMIRNKALLKDLYKAYENKIKKFASDQIKNGRISKNLAYLYQEIYREYQMDAVTAESFSSLLFIHQITVQDKNCSRIVLIHDKAVGEKLLPLKDGVVLAPIFSMDYDILLEDEKGNRYQKPDSVKVSPLLLNTSFLELVKPYAMNSLGLTLYLCEGEKDAISVDATNAEGFNRLLHSDRITQAYRKEILIKLVEYDFSMDMVRELSELLDMTAPKMFDGVERGDFIRIMVARGRYDQAFEWVMEYGAEQIEIKYLMRLASRLLERRDFEKDDRMIDLCAYIFRNHKYDYNILRYLVDNLETTTQELKNLWVAAESFDIEVYPLLERLMVQMLFGGVFLREKNTIYEEYVKAGASQELELSFLSRFSYDYFIRGSIGDERVFRRMLELLVSGDPLNKLCRLAVLQYFADFKKTSEDNKDLFSHIIETFLEKGIVFQFFKKYSGFITKASFLGERSFIEYHAKKNSTVILHYVLERGGALEEEYRKEEMQHMFGGIFSRSFVLFTGDRIQYYITEENSNSEQLTESNCLTCPENEDLPSGRYKDLNDIAISLEMQDTKALKAMIKDYRKKEFILGKLFDL